MAGGTHTKPSRKAVLGRRISRLESLEGRLRDSKPGPTGRKAIKRLRGLRKLYTRELKLRNAATRALRKARGDPEKQRKIRKKARKILNKIYKNKKKLYGPLKPGDPCVPCVIYQQAKKIAETQEKRPLLGQERNDTCAMASTRMVLATYGINASEADVRNASQRFDGAYTRGSGTKTGKNVPPLLNSHGINARHRTGMSVADLQRATAGGRPAVARLKDSPHAIVVDGVRTNPNGSRTVLVRDPWPPGRGRRREISEDKFNERFYGAAVVTSGRRRRR